MRRMLLLTMILLLSASVALADRSIDGSTVIISPATGEHDAAFEICFEVFNGSDDFEYLVDLTFGLPSCFTILDTAPATATPEDGVEFTVEPVFTGYGSNVASWHGGTEDFGFMLGLSTAYFCCTVQLDCDCDIIYEIPWLLEGDGWGDPSHSASGIVEFYVPECSTPTGSSTWSTIKGLY